MDTAPAFLDSRDFGRIARAIRFIDANFRAQPRLAAIAASAHLSEFHFNRLFRRWAGVDRKSTRLNSSHLVISYAVFCLKKKNKLVNTNPHHRVSIERDYVSHRHPAYTD